MTRQRTARRRTRVLMLSAAISMALIEHVQAQSSPFARRGVDPGAQAAQAAQQQGLLSAQASQMAQQSLEAFQRAAQARSSLDAAQAAARAAAAASQSGNEIPNGLGVGGLQVATNVVVDTGPINSSDARLGQNNIWFGAQLPTQTVANGQTDVTIAQTQQKAILNWNTFNIGKNTQLTFDQSAGGANSAQWIALNRVNDPSLAPSRILGSIKAQGQVYVLNRNGVIFGGTSQVNTHALLVSSLDLFTSDLATSNKTFIQTGLFGDTSGQAIILTGIDQLAAGKTPGDITVEAGAQIGSGANGYTLLVAPNVGNAGSITAQDGQVMLAAVIGMREGQLLQSLNSNKLPVSFDLFQTPAGTDLSHIGTLVNTGLVSSTRGDATLVGYILRQLGIVTATTSISRPGSVALLALDQNGNTTTNGNLNRYFGGILDIGSGSITSVLPEEDGETTTSSAGASLAFQAPTMTLAGAQVDFENDSLVFAPGATLNIIGWGVNPRGAPGRDVVTMRIWMDRRAVINVSGLANVTLDMSSNLIEIPRIGQNELSDSPLQRDSFLFRSPIVFDLRDTGVRDDGLGWVGSPLLNAQGYVDQVPRTIDQTLTNGGTVNISGSDFVMNSGAQLDLNGGFLHVLGGMVQTPRLVGSDGRLYDLANADPSMTYVGFAGEQQIDHPRWGVQQTFDSPLLGSSLYYESDYVQGGNAGTLNINLGRDPSGNDPTDNLGALVLGGDLSAEAVSGRYQILSGKLALGGTLNLDTNGALLSDATEALNGMEHRNWQISDGPAEVPDGLGIDTPVTSLPSAGLSPLDSDNPGFWSVLSTAQIANAGFSQVAIGNAGVVTSDAGSNLQVADGGRIAINASRIDLQGTLTAHAGTIALQSAGGDVFANVPLLQVGGHSDRVLLGRGDIVLGADAVLDVSGRWVNDDRDLTDQPSGMANINGGSISLGTRQNIVTAADGTNYDATGSILLAPGTVLDANSGGYINANGVLATRNGVPLGHGGNISLQTYVEPSSDTESSQTYVVNLPTRDDQTGLLQFQGATLLDNSFAGGGTLTLRALGIQIGGTAPSEPRILYLPSDYFDGKGFGGYNLSAELDATIVAGTTVHVSQMNLLPDFEALRAAATGTDILAGLGTADSNAFVAIGQLDDYHRPATNFSLSAGDYLGRHVGNPTLLPATGTLLLDEGASLMLDAGANARLGSRGQVTVLGDITAHGGNITLSGDSSKQSGLSPANPLDPRAWFDPGKSVWVGADAILDVSGVALINPLVPLQPTDAGLVQPRTGVVLNGGSITLTNDTGYVVVEQGAQFDLSGAHDTFDLPTDAGQLASDANTLQPTSVWSNGGKLTLAASAGLYFDGSIHAAGGSAQARGGELDLLPLATPANGVFGGVAATGIVFTQSDSHMPDGLTPGATVEAGASTPSGLLYFAADRLNGSGIDTLVVGNQHPDDSGVAPPLVPIGFSGDVDLSVARALVFNAPLYQMLPDGGSDFSVLGSDNHVQLNAAYVALNGFHPSHDPAVLPTLAQPGATTLDVNADFIDIGGQVVLSGVGTASFDSSGDIRFHTPALFAFENITNAIARPGELLTAGDLNFTAAQLYPASGETFDVLAIGAVDPATHVRAQTHITVSGNGNDSAFPLSAGGTLALDATDIAQDGTIRAPSGSIVLGVSDPNDAGTQALFGGVDHLIRTHNVELGDGSLTSVSLDGAVLPYGTTVDGSQWQYDADPFGSNQNLIAPPQKRIELGGASVSLDPGAKVDLSGGGDLQAVEWVPGTGGSRDLLSQYNTSFSGGTSAQVPLYPDQRGVYAIVPGLQSPVAATDPVFDQGASPIGVGSSVYLSGVPGLPAGIYTLLPAKYATLPGAFRVVQRTGTLDATSALDFVEPDGTAVVSGYYVDALTGARDARSTLFDVQSRDVWGQYSQYNTTSANSFFTALALKQGNAIPQLARDAGQLILAATQRLSLGATLDTAADTGGAGAEIDIASRELQVTDGDHTALNGYVQLNVADLNSLGAGSLLIGGTREQTAQGTRINVLADSVVVSNDAANPLQAPEILLVAGAGQDPKDGLHIDAGSVIQAQGDLSANSIKPILIGSDPNAAGAGGLSGDGAFLRVSDAGDAPLIRSNVPDFADAQGHLTVGAGAQLLGGASLTIDSTGDTQVSADAVLQGKSIVADAGNIRFVTGAADPNADGLVIGDGSLARFADSDSITLRSYGTMDFEGNINLDVQNALTLSAGTFVSDGGQVNLGADHLTLSNDLGAAPVTTASGTGVLNLHGNDVTFGEGDKTLSGFGSVSVDASDAVIVQGKGDFDFGALGVTLKAPVIEAASGADNTLQTTGALTLVKGDGTASASTALGGSLTLEGGSIDSDALIRSASGSVDLHATSGDVVLHDGAQIDVAGTEKHFFDISAYSQGGDITLASDHGNVSVASGTSLDFGASANGGDAGSLTIDATTGHADLFGTLNGAASKGIGGSFTLDVGAAVNLDALSQTLGASGVDNAIWVRTHAGNLVLSAGDTLKGNDVTLIADGGANAQQRDPNNGNIVVAGTIDASGNAGGDIALWGRNGVELDGSLLAKGSAADERGGNVTIGTDGNSDGTLNAKYGYENVQSGDAGLIALGSGAVIDVSGGTAGGLSGGTVDFRAPVLANGDVNVTIANGATISGARDVGLEAYAVWSTSDASSNPAQHFDGIIDPAGWYNAQGALVAGTWTDRAGNALPPPTTPEQTADYLAKYFFTPTKVDAAHSRFYGYLDDTKQTPGTLMGFVEKPGFTFASRFAGIANFHVRPGIELDNPNASVNGGAISVLTSWNLASGASQDALDFRYNGTNAPVLTLRAADDVVLKASLSDGFYQVSNPFGGGGPSATQAQANAAYQTGLQYVEDTYGSNITWLVSRPSNFSSADPAEAQQYYGQYDELLALLLDKPQPAMGSTTDTPISLVDGFLILYAPSFGSTIRTYSGQPTAPAAPTSPAGWEAYLTSYENYTLNLFNFWGNTTGFGDLPTWQMASLPVLGPLLPANTVNLPSLQARLDNPLPLATTSLIGGDSTSYRIIAGADFTSSLPDAFRSASQGNVVLDGHQDYQESGQKDVLQPIVVRTGTGSIDIVAAQDLQFADPLAPASIYTAGSPGEGTSYDPNVSVLRGLATNPDVVVGAQANAEGAGDITLSAGRDIIDNRELFDPDGSISGVAGNYIAQYWWPWMQVGATLSADGSTVVGAPINFGGFAQGVLSAGGNVAINAGRDIRELSVSLPVSYVVNGNDKTLFGGGNLFVHAGRDVLGGDYFVARGDGSLSAGGNIGSAFTLQTQGTDVNGFARDISSAVDPIFALQDGSWSIHARGDAAIGAIVNPSYQVIGEQSSLTLVPARATLDFSADSSVAVSSLFGDVSLNTLSLPGELFNYGQRGFDGLYEVSKLGFDDVLPASLSAVAFGGALSIERSGRMFPSATGELSLLADGDINLYDDTAVQGAVQENALAMLDAPGAYEGDDRSPTALDKLNLHRNDDQPVYVYSLTGDIVGGFASNGFLDNPLTLDLPKSARIRAGRDIVNLDLRGQNYLPSDVTSVIAGRDLYYTPIEGAPVDPTFDPRWSWIQLGGPGTLAVQAGRNLGPLTSANEALVASPVFNTNGGGIRTIGNSDNTGLPAQGATIDLRYGVAPGIDVADFAALYIDPNAADTNATYRAWLADFVLQIENDNRSRAGESPLASLTADQAWTLFEQLPDDSKLLLADRVFLDVLKRTGNDSANPMSPDFGKYGRGYAAINTLFPSTLGYTANNLEGGANGATTQVATGEFDMRGSTVQTERGGDIRIVGPGGNVLVGSISAPPTVIDEDGNTLIGPNQQGILALGLGDIGVFSDTSVLLAQSRIFAERGGDLTLWSSNGDINAGKGAKTSSDKPPITYLCDQDHYCFVDARGEVSGAGIATLQTQTGDPSGNAVLVAPRGTVDAGDAGIRVAGNLIVASQFVANADNIDVKGSSVGVSASQGVNTGALSAASSASSAVADAAGSIAQQRPTLANDMPSIISVQVLGFGNCENNDPRCKPQ